MKDKSGVSSEGRLSKQQQRAAANLDYAFTVSDAKTNYEVSGSNLVGVGSLVIHDKTLGQQIDIGQGQFVRVVPDGVIVRRLEDRGTKLEFVAWNGKATTLGITAVSYRIPVKTSSMIQGGIGYSSPGNCGVVAHTDSMAYAYDFMGALNAHALASADGLVVFANQSTLCNFVLPACPDYSATGCPGMYLGNVIVLQHADGTYSAMAHLSPNSFQAAVGTSVCAGQYLAIQGHTGSAGGGVGPCGDHVHFQRQSTGDFLSQSIAVTLSDAASNPLSCTNYTSGNTEITNNISPSSATFTPTGGTGSVSVTSTGCVWSAISNATWLTITNPGSGSGASSVKYSVAANSGGSRTGTLNIGGKTFTVTQSGTGATNTAPVVNAGPDQTVLVTDTPALAGTVTDDGLPSSTLTIGWSKVSGPGSVIFGNSSSASTTVSFNLAGIYVLRLTASDGQLTSQDDVKVVVNITNGGGALTGNPVTPPASVNLTAEGSEDWADWGLNSATDFNHKNIASRQISDINKIGPRPTIRFSGSKLTTFWSDGSPTVGPGTNTAGIYTYDTDNGFEINAPADTTDRTLKVYVDAWRCTGRLEVTLSDGSASPYVDTSIQDPFNLNGGTYAVYTLIYHAASPGQFVNVRWTLINPVYPAGNVALQAATLSLTSNARPVVNAGPDQVIAFPLSAILNGSATDDGLPNPPGR